MQIPSQKIRQQAKKNKAAYTCLIEVALTTFRYIKIKRRCTADAMMGKFINKQKL